MLLNIKLLKFNYYGTIKIKLIVTKFNRFLVELSYTIFTFKIIPLKFIISCNIKTNYFDFIQFSELPNFTTFQPP